MFFRIILKVKTDTEFRPVPFCGIKFMEFSTFTAFITAVSPTQDLLFRAEVAKN